MDVKLKLTNINQALIDFKVIYEILTKIIPDFKLILRISTNSPRFNFNLWNSIHFFEGL
jgi:hypothetical protein